LLVRFHLPHLRRLGRIESLAASILAVTVLAGAGIPSIAAGAAADPSASPAPSGAAVSSGAAPASPSPSPSASPVPSASPSPSTSPGGSPFPPAITAPLAPIPTPTPPPGAVAVFTVQGQPYRLPAFVALGSWQVSNVSFYGPGFYCILNGVKNCLPQGGGAAWPNGTACGVMYTRTLVGVANRTLPCGTLVAFSYGGRTVVAPVVDRGPYVTGRNWDLSGGLCQALRHCFTGPIRWTIVHRALGPVQPLRISLRYL
jgi:rare lipoprotein A (peptidoglycan hydrolase)